MDAQRQQAQSKLLYAPANELHAYWGYVAPRLAIVAKRSQGRWLPEDVYHALKAGTATLHIGEDGDEYAGFIVLCPTVDFDGIALTVWAVFSEEKYDVIERFECELVNFARQMKAKRITFTSPRGWGRRLKRYGYVQKTVVFEKDV
jgi:hypothetical protein